MIKHSLSPAFRFATLALALSPALAASAWALPAKTYQVTGPVLEVNDKTITVQKGKEKWEIARDASAEIPADVKKGDKVTVQYYMVAAKATKGSK